VIDRDAIELPCHQKSLSVHVEMTEWSGALMYHSPVARL